MEKLLVLFLMTFASAAFANNSCTYVMKDRYGSEIQTFTRDSYSGQSACSDADYSCRVAMSDAQRNGNYRDVYCEQKRDGISIGGISIGGIGGISIGGIGGSGGITIGRDPNRPPNPPSSATSCRTDMVDYYNTLIRSFTGYGQNQRQACAQSEEFCNYELYRNNSNGRRCITRSTNGGGGYPYPQPTPPRQVTENCRATRYDPSGYFIQSYNQTYTGPIYSDVKGEACRRAYNQCSYELKGRQTCRIER